MNVFKGPLIWPPPGPDPLPVRAIQSERLAFQETSVLPTYTIHRAFPTLSVGMSMSTWFAALDCVLVKSVPAAPER